MENRFGVKDFFLFLLIIVLIVSVWLAIKQYDRQWEQIKLIQTAIATQTRDLREVQETLRRGVAMTPATTQGSPTTAEADDKDPFARLRDARRLSDYSPGGVLIDAFGNTVGKLTPLVSSDTYASSVQSFVLESLADRNPDTLEWKPLLARDWEVIDNTAAFFAFEKEKRAAGVAPADIRKDPDAPAPIKIKFWMRPDVRFSDGTPLTVDDVVFTFSFIMDNAINSPREKAYYDRIRSVEKTGPDEVTFSYRDPYFEAFDLAAGMGILPRHFYGQFKPEEFNNSVGYLMGSGPYCLPDPKSWKPGTLIQLVRNEKYWGVFPAFDRMIWKEITNDVARLAEFRNGDVDLFAAVPEQYRGMIKDADLLQRTQHFEYQNPIGGYRFVAWNQKRNGKSTVFADPRVRKAMTLLLDRQRMIQEIMLGYAVEATGPFNPLSRQYNPQVQPWPFDPAAAKKLLAEAGFTDTNGDNILEGPDGRPFEFKLTYPGGSGNYQRMALFMKDAYARAGVVLQADPLDWAVMVERLNKKDFDAITLGWSAGIESDIFQMFHSSQSMAEGDNFMSYGNEELDAIIEEARRTLDEEKRMELWRQAHAILHQDQPYTFLFYSKSLIFLDARIQNVQRVKLGLNPRIEWFVPVPQQRSAH